MRATTAPSREIDTGRDSASKATWVSRPAASATPVVRPSASRWKVVVLPSPSTARVAPVP